VLLHGDIGTISSSPISRKLMRRFEGAIKKRFSKIGSYYYVGPRALELLKSGARLTAAEQCPREHDLVLEPPNKKPPQVRGKKSKTTGRYSYAKSCEYLQLLGHLEKGEIPTMPPGLPRDEEGQFGISFFRTCVVEDDLEDLTLPRTFIGRSEVMY